MHCFNIDGSFSLDIKHCNDHQHETCHTIIFLLPGSVKEEFSSACLVYCPGIKLELWELF